jgi:hypothetical protein
MLDEDFDVDDVLTHYTKRKKKKDSSRKGKRGEGGLIKVLEKRFPGKPFSRTLGSGNRWSQARLTETAKKVFTGDIICPEDFLFALESKHGYNDINIERAIARLAKTGGEKGNALLDDFLEQAEKDGERISKMPMMCWKADYKPWLAFLKSSDVPIALQNEEKLIYRDWSIFPLEKVLELSDDHFMKAADVKTL